MASTRRGAFNIIIIYCAWIRRPQLQQSASATHQVLYAISVEAQPVDMMMMMMACALDAEQLFILARRVYTCCSHARTGRSRARKLL